MSFGFRKLLNKEFKPEIWDNRQIAQYAKKMLRKRGRIGLLGKSKVKSGIHYHDYSEFWKQLYNYSFNNPSLKSYSTSVRDGSLAKTYKKLSNANTNKLIQVSKNDYLHQNKNKGLNNNKPKIWNNRQIAKYANKQEMKCLRQEGRVNALGMIKIYTMPHKPDMGDKWNHLLLYAKSHPSLKAYSSSVKDNSLVNHYNKMYNVNNKLFNFSKKHSFKQPDSLKMNRNQHMFHPHNNTSKKITLHFNQSNKLSKTQILQAKRSNEIHR